MHSKRDDKKKKDSNSLTEIRFLKVFYCQKALNEAHKMHLPRKELSLSELKKIDFLFQSFLACFTVETRTKSKKKIELFNPDNAQPF